MPSPVRSPSAGEETMRSRICAGSLVSLSVGSCTTTGLPPPCVQRAVCVDREHEMILIDEMVFDTLRRQQSRCTNQEGTMGTRFGFAKALIALAVLLVSGPALAFDL